ncbi:peptidase M61 [Rapidithrix thailandica]|uniref:Peptidase M61 n=1 Tax=Rapidithrix thailandica TaxID=413964 RepID=A0AAW9RWF4_9BACT
MNKLVSCLLLGVCLSMHAFGQKQYNVQIALDQVKNDRLKVLVRPPKIRKSSIVYVIPNAVPGSYSLKNFAKYFHDFKAFDKKGNLLPLKKLGDNLIEIEQARKLERLEYWVDDTWDSSNEDFIFQPAGTNIDAGYCYVINHQGFFGYFDGYEDMPYFVHVKKPEKFYGATALKLTNTSKKEDLFFAANYAELVDSPVMYSKPDTLSFAMGNAKVNIAIYSESKKVSAQKVRDIIQPLSAAFTSFFQTMPVEEYSFIMYFSKSSSQKFVGNGGYGALEHSYSSFYYLPEINNQEALSSMVLDVASHEFLHILTPLHLHSNLIEKFDYHNPVMSKHLWLYEGVIEYFSHLIQLKSGIISEEEFREVIGRKVRASASYTTGSFTEMSKNILKESYQAQFSNVYNKGALLAFLMDIRLLELSKGKLSLRKLLLSLTDKYGPQKPFEEEVLFDELVAHSYPEMKDFISRYIEKGEALPLHEYFGKIGWDYHSLVETEEKTFGVIEFDFDQTMGQYRVAHLDPSLNLFKIKTGDRILQINGQNLTNTNAEELLKSVLYPNSFEEVKMTVERQQQTLELKARPMAIMTEREHILMKKSNSLGEEDAIKKRILGGSYL